MLTGSSGRKLKRGGANLLAGRAFVRELFPLLATELGASFKITEALAWGTRPFLYALHDAEEKAEYLASYVRTYVSEEIQQEQVGLSNTSWLKYLASAPLLKRLCSSKTPARGSGLASALSRTDTKQEATRMANDMQ